MHSSDVMIAVSLRPYRRYTIDAAVPLREARGSLVVITVAVDDPLCRYAPESVVIDILTALSTASAKGAVRRLADRERLALELGLYPAE